MGPPGITVVKLFRTLTLFCLALLCVMLVAGQARAGDRCEVGSTATTYFVNGIAWSMVAVQSNHREGCLYAVVEGAPSQIEVYPGLVPRAPCTYEAAFLAPYYPSLAERGYSPTWVNRRALRRLHYPDGTFTGQPYYQPPNRWTFSLASVVALLR